MCMGEGAIIAGVTLDFADLNHFVDRVGISRRKDIQGTARNDRVDC